MGKRIRKSEPDLSHGNVYCGSLRHVDGGEEIEVSRFIVRPDEIAFDLLMSVDTGGNVTFSGKAKLTETGAYVTGQLVGTGQLDRFERVETVLCQFMFAIRKQSTRRVDVTGQWIGGGESEGFGGILDVFVPRKR